MYYQFPALKTYAFLLLFVVLQSRKKKQNNFYRIFQR